ncbi:hypothetical protein KKF84_01905 [Myxococcota bacterium]|nr:hypothetical protein [Myxococcota bacterium]
MCKETLMNRITETEDEIEKAERAISSAQYELSNLKDEVDELRDDEHHDLLMQIHEFLVGLEKKTRPCRIATVNRISSEEDPHVCLGLDTTYFDWGFEDMLTKIKGVL